ncbi:uncharacterized protein F4812DRAFT_431055 [Daldinia caldariorum]|uniref:uncharacterized protein n=1 Tax=Daldinia caldariorum TaxID=326644 RepID=UPI0020074826|nr:uncharacterized protein F4812DRAFT_431055 [Daldinia caldariorum]KAI1467070.1 hypothetical protein F4812DRAFT_431055 [Daldinia caldariorum]
MRLPPIALLTSRSTEHRTEAETKVSPEMVIGTILATLVTVILTIRLYTRRRLTRGFGLDDIFIALAYLPITAFTIIGIIFREKFQHNHQSGHGNPDLAPGGIQLVFANQILFELAASLTKLSILTLLYRLTTASRDRRITIAVLISMGFISVNCAIFIIVSCLQCIPLSDYWNISVPSRHCIDWNIHMFAASVINTTTDWVVVLLPIRIALGLNLPIKQLGMVIFLFGLGVLACSAGIARSYFAWNLAFHSSNITRDRRFAWFTSTVELNFGIICASIPAARPFFITYLPEVFRSFRQRSSMIFRDRIPLTNTTSFTTFIDRSLSTLSLPRRLTPLPSSHQRVNLNKPLPPIRPPRHTNPEAQAETETYLNPSYNSLQVPPRSYYRANT